MNQLFRRGQLVWRLVTNFSQSLQRSPCNLMRVPNMKKKGLRFGYFAFLWLKKCSTHIRMFKACTVVPWTRNTRNQRPQLRIWELIIPSFHILSGGFGRPLEIPPSSGHGARDQATAGGHQGRLRRVPWKTHQCAKGQFLDHSSCVVFRSIVGLGSEFCRENERLWPANGRLQMFKCLYACECWFWQASIYIFICRTTAC